jgi:hypothetical protein
MRFMDIHRAQLELLGVLAFIAAFWTAVGACCTAVLW